MRARKKATKSCGIMCFGKGLLVSLRNVSRRLRAWATADLSSSGGGGGGTSSSSYSQVHILMHRRGSRLDEDGMSEYRKVEDESAPPRHSKGYRSPRVGCGTSVP